MDSKEPRLKDPLLALEQLVDTNDLADKLGEALCGPSNTLTDAVSNAHTRDEVTRLHNVLRGLSVRLESIERVREDDWKRYEQLILLRVGLKEVSTESALRFSPDATVKRLKLDGDSIDHWKPQPEEYERLQGACQMLQDFGWKKEPQFWSLADWRLLGFVNDLVTTDKPPSEKTPVLLANAQTGKVLWLVGERLPGPSGLVTPHWERLGLLSLGDEDQLLKAIHRGFQSQILYSDARYQFRWWFEQYRGGSVWYDYIGKARSIEVAAACLARALLQKRDDSVALLDSKTSVSAKLNGDSVGIVEHVNIKTNAALSAGVEWVLLAEKCCPTSEPGQKPSVLPIRTLEDAYEGLLATNASLESWKKSEASKFIHIGDLETKSGKHIEVRTHRDFFVSEQDGDQDANLPDASELENDSRFEQAEPGVEYFMLRQTVWHAEATDNETLWNLAEREDEPSDEKEPGGAGGHPENMSKSGGSGKWVRLGGETGRLVGREELVRHALSGSDAWQRVGVVCGAGLGKTTNFEWLASRINRLDNGRGKDLAIFLELNNLPSDLEELLELILQQMKNVTHREQHELLKFGVERLLVEGRVTFLADGLDQATQSDPIETLEALMKGRWEKCRVWISGRPYAFRNNRSKLAELELATDWNFLRIGQLEEPECRQLLETFKRPSAPPAVPA